MKRGRVHWGAEPHIVHDPKSAAERRDISRAEEAVLRGIRGAQTSLALVQEHETTGFAAPCWPLQACLTWPQTSCRSRSWMPHWGWH